MPIHAILFDVGGTLLEPFPSVGATYSRVAAQHGVKIPPSELDQKFKTAWKKQKTLQTQVNKDWWRAVVNDVFHGVSFGVPDAFFEDVYHAFSNPEAWKVYEDVRPTLERLKFENFCLAVASNWDERLPRLLEKLGLAKYFDYIFVSGLVGYSKPDKRFYDHALKMMGMEPSEVIHIGDDPIEDIDAAASVGIKAALIDRPGGINLARTLSVIISQK